MGYPDNPLIYDMLKDEMILIKKGLNGFANDDIMLISDRRKMMGEYKIEKNIPLIPKREKHKPIYASMKIGDSFEFPAEDKMKIISNSHAYGKRAGMKFTIRGNRIWRIE